MTLNLDGSSWSGSVWTSCSGVQEGRQSPQAVLHLHLSPFNDSDTNDVALFLYGARPKNVVT